MIDAFIIQDGDILNSVIIYNKTSISEIPSVRLLALILEHDEVFEPLKNNQRIK